jgi:hypothetical protein
MHAQTIGLMGGCHTVVIDALRLAPEHGSHFTVGQALAAVRRVRPVPRKCWLIGMNHEGALTSQEARGGGGVDSRPGPAVAAVSSS